MRVPSADAPEATRPYGRLRQLLGHDAGRNVLKHTVSGLAFHT